MTAWTDNRHKSAQRKRPVPKMPEGYYSGDRPNPRLREFVEENMRPYDPATDRYDVPPFNEPITTTKATAIYNMHTYWSKKPHDAIRQYIRHYTRPGDIVLDPFCGSGGTALAALMEGRKAIAIDRSPAATFITKNYCTPVDVDELQRAFEELKARVKPEIDWLYETRCDRCGGKAATAYTVYSQRFRCPRCLEVVALFDCPEVDGRTAKGKPKKIRVCPHCQRMGHQEEIKTSAEHFGAVPVLVSYICESGCKPARSERRHDDPDPKKREYFELYDLGKIREIEGKEIPHWYPDVDLKSSIPYRMLFKKDFRPEDAERLVDFFTKRNLWALAAIKSNLDLDQESEIKYILQFILSATLLNVSKLIQEVKSRRSSNSYYLPQIGKEIHVFESFTGKARLIKTIGNSFMQSQIPILVSTQSSCDISLIASNSVDYIFTDPPYAGNVQYGELNFVWEAWLGLDTQWHDEEIIVNEIRGKTLVGWTSDMLLALRECYRVLKPGRAISLCYHDTDEGTWTLIQDVMAEVGFIPEKSDSALYIDTGQKTYNQSTADKVNKRDLVINFRKPKPGETGGPIITELDDFHSFQEKVRIIISDFLAARPGSTKDRIYDEVVSRMVRRGQMEPHHFDAILEQVAEAVHPEGERMARWYLREEASGQEEAESRKEDAAAAVVSRHISDLLRKSPEAEGIHYSEIFEHYIYAVSDKPRRALAEWLPDYFYKNTDGTWRLPADEEEARLKQEGRAAGLSRRIRRYLSYIEGGLPVPESERPGDATLAEWIRHCKRSGLHREGKMLYERGGLRLDRLGDEAAVNVEEDYMICNRMISGEEKKHPRRRGGR
ncbi:MAG TPA: DNA methyltransferase [Methanothrix sp.]|nr:DNA methyltransferase [Methanothrix sp.]